MSPPSTWAPTRPACWSPTSTVPGARPSSPLSIAGRRSRGSARASTATARCIPTRSSGRSRCCANTGRSSTTSAPNACGPPPPSAARDAGNRDALFGPVEQILGIRPELLAGEEEARLEFVGATAGLTEPGPYLVVDVGGGSTEFIVGTEDPEALTSLDVGCVRLTEQFLRSDPPTAEELSQAVSVVRDQLADVGRLFPAMSNAPTLVGTAGTVWTLAAIELGVDAGRSDVIDHFRLTRAAAEDVFRTLATERIEQRRHNPGLEPGRVDVIVGGAIVVVSVMRQWGYDSLLVSEADILDGLARDSV